MDNGRIGYENYMVKREELDDIFNQYIKTELDNSVTKILNELPPVYKEIIELLNIPFEKIGDEIVGIKFDDSNNIEFITKNNIQRK